MSGPPRQPIAALTGADRVLAVLRSLGGHPRGVGLEELARELSLPKSSMHRALAALCRSGLVEHDAGGDYRIGLELVRIAFAFHRELDRRQIVEPVLEAFVGRFAETAHYAELDGTEIVYLAKVAPRGAVQMTSHLGGRNPAHCTGVGKALLAAALPDRAAVEKYVAAHGPLVRRTARTLVDAEALHADLEATRARGYALDDGENEDGINCLAFALYLEDRGRPTGAISISALAHRTPLAALVASSGEARGVIEQTLGAVIH